MFKWFDDLTKIRMMELARTKGTYQTRSNQR